jgi:CRP-like cAMP-binding protein
MMITLCKKRLVLCCVMQFRMSYPISRFIIIRGSCSVYIKDFRGASNHVATLNPGCSFGELAFVDICSRRAATVLSNDETFLLVVEESSKQYVTDVRSTILLDRQRKYSFLKSIVHPYVMSRTNRIECLAVEVHKQADREFRELAKFAFSKRFHSGAVVFQQGSACGSVFIVVSGTVDIIVTLQGTHASQQIDAPSVPFQTRQKVVNQSITLKSEQPIPVTRAPIDMKPHNYAHNNLFYSKLISDVINHSNVSRQTERNSPHFKYQGSTTKCPSLDEKDFQGTESSVKSLCQIEKNFIPRPPFLQKKNLCSPRARNLVHDSRSRMNSKSFRLKAAMSGNIVGDDSTTDYTPIFPHSLQVL